MIYRTIPAHVYRIVFAGFDGATGAVGFRVTARDCLSAIDAARAQLPTCGQWAMTACENLGPST